MEHVLLAAAAGLSLLLYWRLQSGLVDIPGSDRLGGPMPELSIDHERQMLRICGLGGQVLCLGFSDIRGWAVLGPEHDFARNEYRLRVYSCGPASPFVDVWLPSRESAVRLGRCVSRTLGEQPPIRPG